MQSRIIILFILISYSLSLHSQDIIAGAENTSIYLSKVKGKKLAIACNASSIVGNVHLVDTLRSLGMNIVKIFAPEHGFRGDMDAGAHVKSGRDAKTGIEIKSLYGENKKPSVADFQGIDLVIFDIQDVGVRFYTYISTLQYLMEACAEFKTPIMVLDRPNPNGHYVDGPVLDMKYKSFVGMQPVPIVYGMTIGEYAQMLVGEGWLKNKISPKLSIIACENYSHNTKVSLKIAPSPNLKSSQAIALYPSLCLFEGTNVSVGRGTNSPFEKFGSPWMKKEFFDFTFTPKSLPGATNPPFLNQICYGEPLNMVNVKPEFSPHYLMIAYSHWAASTDSFFLKNLFFDKLAGNSTLRQQIITGKTVTEIRKSWEPALSNFKKIRSKYLIYKD